MRIFYFSVFTFVNFFHSSFLSSNVPCKNIKNQTSMFLCLHGVHSLWFLDMPLNNSHMTLKELLQLAGSWRSYGLASPFFSQHPLLRGPVLIGRIISCLSVRGWSLLPPGDIIVTLLRHCCDVIMQHAAAEEDDGTFFRLCPTTFTLLPLPGLLLWRCCWSCLLKL